MSERVLCVDDEPNVLAGYQRQLRKEFDLSIAVGGEEGLATMTQRGPFAVIVSDMRMPGLTGVQFLARARALAPESVRMLLTGYAEMQSAIDAINEGSIFRFLTKPCPPEAFAKALQAGVEQYRLVRAEKELLEQTLRGSIKVLSELLALVNPLAFGKASRVQRLAQRLGRVLQMENPWQVEVAAMLSQIGCVAVPDALLNKVYAGTELEEKEQEMFAAHPRVGRDLLRQIPRLEGVAEIIAYQEKLFSGRGQPEDGKKGSEIPLGARILKVALDCDNLEARGKCRAKVLECLKGRAGWYDTAVLKALEEIPEELESYSSQVLLVREMRCQMILAEDVLTNQSVMLVRNGQEITEALLQRLRNFSVNKSIREPLKVLVPLAAS